MPDIRSNYELPIENPSFVARQSLSGLKNVLTTFEPHVVYYYGHGIGTLHQSRLVFVKGPHKQRDERPIGDFAQKLRGLREPPRFVYVNCCSGDAGGFLGAGWQLGDFVPAVIESASVVSVETVRPRNPKHVKDFGQPNRFTGKSERK